MSVVAPVSRRIVVLGDESRKLGETRIPSLVSRCPQESRDCLQATPLVITQQRICGWAPLVSNPIGQPLLFSGNRSWSPIVFPRQAAEFIDEFRQ